MKKKILAIVISAVLCVSFMAGCGSSAGESSTSSEAVSEESQTTSGVSTTSETSGDITSQTSAVSSLTESEAASASSETAEASSETSEAASSTAADTDTELLSGTYHAELVIKDYGTIKLELDADTAPITVTNFVKLAKEGFYDGLTFHRIISGFMIQGGDPLGNGTGGSDETIKGEFSENGVENNISHTRGTISMARAQDPDSASSQFFIMHEDGTYLDGQYAAFGHVTDGMDVVDKICETVEVTDQNGTVKDGQQPVIESLTITD